MIQRMDECMHPSLTAIVHALYLHIFVDFIHLLLDIDIDVQTMLQWLITNVGACVCVCVCVCVRSYICLYVD